MEERIELDIRVPNSTCYLGMIGHIGEAMARTLRDYHGDREELAYHLNLVLTEATANAMKHGNAPAHHHHCRRQLPRHQGF